MDLNDKTSNGNHLTNSGAAASGDTPFAGSTTSTDFDSGDYLWALDHTSLDLATAVSLECWVYFDSFPQTWNNLIIKATTDFKDNYRLAVQNNGTILFQYYDANNDWNNFTSPAGTVSTGAWIHLAATYTGGSPSSAKLYKDGSEVASCSWSYSDGADSLQPNGENLVIGAIVTDNLDGRIDEARVWNDYRTATEISNNYQVELVGNEQGLVAYYPFESLGGAGRSAASGRSATGTRENAGARGAASGRTLV